MKTQENGKITLFYSFSILTITIEVQPLITTIWDFRKQLILEKNYFLFFRKTTKFRKFSHDSKTDH
jgi:hypothetical protein